MRAPNLWTNARVDLSSKDVRNLVFKTNKNILVLEIAALGCCFHKYIRSQRPGARPGLCFLITY